MPTCAFLHFILLNNLLVQMMSGSNLLLAQNTEKSIAVQGEQPGEVWAVEAMDKKRRLRSAAGGRERLRPTKDEGMARSAIREDPSFFLLLQFVCLSPGNNFMDHWNTTLQGYEGSCEQENLTFKKWFPKRDSRTGSTVQYNTCASSTKLKWAKK